MPTKNEIHQQAWRKYEHAHGHLPASTRVVVEWAVENKLLPLPEVDPYDILARSMADALREEYETDEFGRRYRVNHAVRVTAHGVQQTFWAIMGFAPREHMQMAFTQRRNQIIGDCLQLKTDVEAYNDMNQGEEPIQLVLDFTDDVAEREYWTEDRRAA